MFLIILVVVCGPACAQDENIKLSDNRALMSDFLRDALRQQKGWVKVHAAEALLQNNMPQGVNEIFTKELNTDDPQYRIGVMRVLIKAPDVPQTRKEEYIQQIRKAFDDKNGKARVHAAETLGKLGVHFRSKELSDFAEKVGGGSAAYGRWVLANSNQQADLNYLTELLESEDKWEKANVAYSIRYMDSIDSQWLERLERCLAGLDEKSAARVYVLSALCKHVKDISKKQRLEQLVKHYLHNGNNDDKKEACVAIGNLKQQTDVPVLIDVFEKEANVDVKIFIADAFLKLSAITKQNQTALNKDWPVDRKFRLKIQVDPQTVAQIKQAPFTISVDFGNYLQNTGIPKCFDPSSVVVTALDTATTTQTVVDYLLDESFQAGAKGWVAWNIGQPGQTHYYIYFDVLENGPRKAESKYVPMVGIGDNPRYNNPGQLSPLSAMAIRPVSKDFDGDGLIDIVSPAIYTSTWGQPTFTFWFWKNIGSNEKPVFADFVRLYDAEGKIISNGYDNCELFDWNADGKLDLITRNGIYLNKGNAKCWRMPVLEKTEGSATQAGGQWNAPLKFYGFRDIDGDGDLDAIYGYYAAHYVYEGNPARNFIKTGLFVAMNTAGKGKTPQFKSVEPLFEKEPTRENVLTTDLYDFDSDGKPDIIGTTYPLDKNPPEPKFCYWPNISKRGQKPRFGGIRILPRSDVEAPTAVVSVNNKAFNGMFVTDGYRVRFFQKAKGQVGGAIPNHVDKGLLIQVDGRCSVKGFSGVEVKDWEGDGDWDLIAGDELGFVWLIKNIGDNNRPVFETARHVMVGNVPMRIMRWQFIQDGNPEYFLGQTKPRYADWDGDGDMDLVVGNNADGLGFFENVGTRERPEFSGMKKIEVDGDSRPFADRNRPAVLDWDGDGLTDIVTKDKDGRLGLFKGISGAKNAVKPIKKFKYIDGSEIKLGALGSMLWQWEACDWDSDGDYDLISQIGSWGNSGPGLYENVGTNVDPKFKPAVRIKCFGKDIHISDHETTFSCVDWYGQGKPDLFCGGESGWFYFFRRPVIDAPTPPSGRVADKLEMRNPK